MNPSENIESALMFSVIIPTWNRRDQLALLLNDLINQKAEVPFEVIVSDSHSPDGTAAMIEGMSRLDSRIRLIQCENSPAAKRNAGARIASGTHLLFLDDDVRIPSKSVFCELIGEIGSSTDTILNGRVCYPEAWLVSSNYYRYRNSRHVSDPRYAGTDVGPWQFVSMCAFLPTELYFRVGGYQESYSTYGGEDHDFEFRSRALGVRHLFSGALEAEHYEGFTGVDKYVKKFSRAATALIRLTVEWPQYMKGTMRLAVCTARRLAPVYPVGGRWIVRLAIGRLSVYLEKTDRIKWLYSPSLYRLLTFLALVDGLASPAEGAGFYGSPKES